MNTDSSWTYLTLQQYTKKYATLSNDGMRTLIFSKEINGLSSSGTAIKMLINQDHFFIF